MAVHALESFEVEGWACNWEWGWLSERMPCIAEPSCRQPYLRFNECRVLFSSKLFSAHVAPPEVGALLLRGL